jgi:hypothetical protein
MIISNEHQNMLISPARTIDGRVELFNGSTLLQTFRKTDALSSFTLSRAGEKKFFGFGLGQELEVKLVDKERLINIEKGQIFKISFGVNNTFLYTNPDFIIDEINRDENTNELTIKAFDAIHKAKSHTVAELGLEAPYTIRDVADAINDFLGLTAINIINVNDDCFDIEYPVGANFDGAEKLREVLDAIAGATQTIYYIDNNNKLAFKRLNRDAAPVLTITKADYFELKSKTNRILSDICSATELGDNVTTTTGNEGETQYIRDNPFWELRNDITTLLENAIVAVGGLSINQFTCKWRGNYLAEPGDKIALVTKDNSTVISFLLDDKYTYNGGFSADSAWEYGDNEGESADNPITLGDALKKTYAKVDKANQEIEIVAGETATIKVTTESISNSVTLLDDNLADIVSEVNTKVTAEDVSFSIQTAMGEGIERVTTTTGFTFNEEGLNISKENSEITTTITEDGMTVYKNNSEVLVADNSGVKAEDLHATTFLIIGNNSRLEDYNGNRTGCFWIGG